MTTWSYTVWLALSGDLERYVTAALEYRRVETEIYRSRFGKKFMTTRDEWQRLLAAGLPLGDRIQEVITIVKPKTFRQWVRDAKQGKEMS